VCGGDSREKRCALKVIDTRNSDAAGLNRIREEINVLSTLGQNQHITSLLDYDDTLSNCIRLVMELCEGGELYDRIQQKQFYPEAEAKTCMQNLLDGVSYVHSKGIMHRDLKPENILLVSKVSHTDVKISDFGLSKMSRNFPERLPRATSICGSDFYLAPEVIRQEEYGREIDVWALGVIAYVLLSGSLPFFHSVLHKLYRKIVERDLTFSEQAWKQVSKGGIDFVLRLLQVRPGDRPTSEMSLTHPWLRRCGPTENSSSMSFHDGNTSWCDSNANYYNDYCYGDPMRSSTSNGVRWPSAQSAVPSSLQYAHKISGEGNQRCIDSQIRGETPQRNHGQTQRNNTPTVSGSAAPK